MILITGANGLLGSFLTNRLTEKGIKVVGLVREGSDLSLLNTNTTHLVLHEGDLLDIPSVELLFETFSVEQVIHSAALVSYQKKDRRPMELVNVEGTRNIVNISLKHNVKYFLHVSSVAALGKSKNNIVDEKSPWINSPENATYSITKHAAEMEVWRGQVEGLDTVIVNPSVILAAADGSRSSSKFFTYLKKEPLFYPTGIFNYVDIRDVATIIFQLMEKRVKNQRFIINAGSVSYQEFFEKASAAAGLRAPSLPVKKNTGRLALIGDFLRSKLLKRQPVLTSESLKISRRMVTFENKKITNFLNYQFIPLEESIEWVWKEYNFTGRVEK